MPDHATHQHAIYVVYPLKATPDRVWQVLTEPELLEQWLFPNDITPETGRRFTFQTKPAPGFDGTITCEVLAVSPPEYLVYTWRTGLLDTVVNFTLDSPTPDATRLTVLHTGFGTEDAEIRELLAGGWRERSAGLLRKLLTTL